MRKVHKVRGSAWVHSLTTLAFWIQAPASGGATSYEWPARCRLQFIKKTQTFEKGLDNRRVAFEEEIEF
jgi:hypothetical protein